MTARLGPLPSTPYVPLAVPDLTRQGWLAERGRLVPVVACGVALNDPALPGLVVDRARDGVERTLQALALLAGAVAVDDPVLVRVPQAYQAGHLLTASILRFPVVDWPDPLAAAVAVQRWPGSLVWQWSVLVDRAGYLAGLS